MEKFITLLKRIVAIFIISYLLLGAAIYAHSIYNRRHLNRIMQTQYNQFQFEGYRFSYHPDTSWMHSLPLIGRNVHRRPIWGMTGDPIFDWFGYQRALNLVIFSPETEVIYDVTGLREGSWHSYDYFGSKIGFRRITENHYYFDGITPVAVFYARDNRSLPLIVTHTGSFCDKYGDDFENHHNFRSAFVKEGDINSVVTKRHYNWLYERMTRTEAERILGGCGKLLNSFEVEGKIHNMGVAVTRNLDGTLSERTSYLEVPGGRFETVGYRSECTVILVTYRLLEDGDWLLVGSEYFNLAYFIRVGTVPPHR